MKILITAGMTGQAHKLKRLLDEDDDFVFADQEAMPFMPSNYRYLQIPSGTSFSFAHEMLKRCLDEQIDLVFPLRKAEIKSLSEAVQLFEEYGIKLVIPERDKVEDLLERTLANGRLKILIEGKIYAAEGDKTALFAEGTKNGLFIVNPENEAEYRIFTVD